mgnify:CR=1 FL=1
MQRKLKHKKILCTLGPASMNDRVIARLTDLGVSIFRVNLSHTRLDELPGVIDFIQHRTSVPICLDTEGAQIRTGVLAEDKVVLEENSVISIPRTSVIGNSEFFNLYPLDTVEMLEAGDILSIDFNSVLAKVVQKNDEGLLIKVLTGGPVGQNKAVSVDREIILPALTQKDIQSLAVGIDKGIKHVALSFANEAKDVDAIKSHVPKETYIISKIESIHGIKNLREIADRSNALLLDRGDLSRQVPIEQIPRAQKEIIQMAKKAKIDIFVATNLLESMTRVTTPTRAEVNDVFNTLVDGADGLVLAAETAIGSYPVQCAIMVSKIVQQFSEFQNGSNFLFENLNKEDSFFLIEPHGGMLVNRCDFNPDYQEIRKYRKLIVEEKDIINAEQIAIGSFSPLKGFMTKNEVFAVIENCQLPNGVIWPLPIFLQVNKEDIEHLDIGQKIALCLKGDDTIYAILDIEDIYTYNLEQLAQGIFGTRDKRHPGAEDIFKRANYFLGGSITLIKRLPSKTKHFEITPRQARKIFEHKGWSRIVGFHTRNVAHRVHEYLQKVAFEKYHCDGIFIHPLTGPKKKGDYNADIVLKSYEIMISRYYPSSQVLLAACQNYPRYAGPREAVFTALCRKNYGCSHFVIGRDHAGVENYYEKDGARKLFSALGEIGIKPIFFNEVHYCQRCKSYVEECGHEEQDILKISGTQGRKMLMDKIPPPDWFMRKDLSDLIISNIHEGKEIFQK